MARPPRLDAALYIGLQRYFLTVCTTDRQRHFANAMYVRATMQELLRTAVGYSFEAVAYCFMPDHMHGLFEALTDNANFVKFAAMFKQRSAFHFKRATGLSLWQEGFHDRILRNDESTLGIAAYIIQNPVRAGLCEDPRQYQFMGSSRYTIDELLDAIAWRP